MNQDERALEALAKIQQEINAGTEVAALNVEKLCEKYRKVKASLELVLPFIARIPVYGQNISDAIRFLMKLADAVCPLR